MSVSEAQPSKHRPDQQVPDRFEWRRVVVTLIKDAAIVIVVLCVLETALQFFAPRYRGHLFDADFTGGHPLMVNSMQMRGPEPVAKREGELRVLALGDSVTFGTGVASEETWPAKLASLLSRDGVAATSLNGGVPAASLKDLAKAVDGAWGDQKPDVAVVALSNNMVSLAWIRRDQEGKMPAHVFPSDAQRASKKYLITTKANRAVRKLCLPAFVMVNAERAEYWLGVSDHSVNPAAPFGAMPAHGWKQLTLPAERSEEAWELFEIDLATLKAATDKRGIALVAFAVPARFMLSDDVSDNEKRVPKQRLTIDPNVRMIETCARLGISTVDVESALLKAKAEGVSPLYRQADYTHFDLRGHEVAADAIASTVENASRR